MSVKASVTEVQNTELNSGFESVFFRMKDETIHLHVVYYIIIKCTEHCVVKTCFFFFRWCTVLSQPLLFMWCCLFYELCEGDDWMRGG